jgi:hypothetical protein
VRPRIESAKQVAHRLFDPLLAWPNAVLNRRRLSGLADGVYRVSVDVPYVSQFANPHLIHAYIHHGFHGRDDPAWATFGSPDPDTYGFLGAAGLRIGLPQNGCGGFQNVSQSDSVGIGGARSGS